MLIATLCFVHCVAGPLLLTFAGIASLISLSEKIEPVFVLSSAALGAATLVPAYRKKHGRLSCLALFAGGLLCLLVRRRIEFGVFQEGITTAVGAALIVGAHALNLRFSKRCLCCNSLDQESQLRKLAQRPRMKTTPP
jgi:hypothetical protein